MSRNAGNADADTTSDAAQRESRHGAMIVGGSHSVATGGQRVQRAEFFAGSTELAEVLPHQGPYTIDRLR